MICSPCREDKHTDCPQFKNGINPTHCDCQHRDPKTGMDYWLESHLERQQNWADQLRTTMTEREG